MAALIGIVIGILATALVGHYYFRRTVNKSLAVYLSLSSHTFAGIEPSVREQLKFHFRDSEIRDLFQLEFIIANDGERAISGFIEPLSVELPKEVEVLDATVLYRRPSELAVDVTHGKSPSEQPMVRFDFPLLNKGEFFLIKLLLNGSLQPFDLEFHILVDDLPRTIKPKRLPRAATREAGPHVEWAGVGVGIFFILIALSQGAGMYLLYRALPYLFPVPWASFRPGMFSTTALVFWTIGTALMFILGLIMFAGMGFANFYKRYPRFPLPSELRLHGRKLILSEVLEDVDLEARLQMLELQKEELTRGDDEPAPPSTTH